MLKYFYFSVIVFTLFSCSKGGGTNNSRTVTTPIGTTVKLEAVIASGTQIPVVQYADAQQNIITLTNVANNWSYTYQTTKVNQYIILQLSGSTVNVTGKIYINGVLKKEATGTVLTISYP